METFQLLPSIPPWHGMHPALVHFPIALLCVTPLFLILGLLYPDQAKRCFMPALILMAFGTLGTYVAAESGDAAVSVLGDISREAAFALEHHEEAADATQGVFTLLTLLYVFLQFGPGWMKKKMSPKMSRALNAAFLVLYSVGILFVVTTADRGGHLVHEFGLRAMLH